MYIYLNIINLCFYLYRYTYTKQNQYDYLLVNLCIIIYIRYFLR